MKRRLAKFRALPWGERLFVVRAVALMLTLRVAIKLVSVEKLLAFASRPRRHVLLPMRRAAYLVQQVAAVIPGSLCLVQALTLQTLAGGELHIGVASREGFRAHAWVARGGTVVLGGAELSRGYTSVVHRKSE